MKNLQNAVDVAVLDLGVGMAPALIAKMLVEWGARLTRIEPEQDDPFYDVYPAYALWRSKSAIVSRAHLDEQLASADVCIIGGEDFPGLDYSFDADELAAANDRLIVLAISGYTGETKGAPRRPAVDLLAQARTGLVFQQYSARPLNLALPAPTYGAALHGLSGVCAALIERDRSGLGQVVRTSLQQGAAMWWSPAWMSAERADARFNANIPKDVRPLIFQCADGGYIHFSFGTPGSVAAMYNVLGVTEKVSPTDRGMPDMTRGLKNFFAPDTGLLERHIRLRNRDELLTALREVRIPAGAVLPPGGCWSDAQAEHNQIISQDPQGNRYVGNPIRFSTGHSAQRAVPERSSQAAERSAPPLAGVRVIDLGSFVAGPYASKVLADFGADVVKVEAPAGDPNRVMHRSFSSANQGKRSICIDAKHAEGAALIRRLCATANAVHHNFRPGVAARLGLDPGTLRKDRPDIVTLEASAFGSTGPSALESGFDMIMQAYCGHEVRAAGLGNTPFNYTSTTIDYAAGALGSIALLLGLLRQKTHGETVEAETNLFNTGVFLLSELIQHPDGTFVGAPLMNPEQTGVHPAERLYETKDAWIAVAARSDEMARQFARCVGTNDAPEARASWGEHEGRMLAERIRLRDSAGLLEELAAAGVWAEACTPDGGQALASDESAKQAGLAIELEDPKYGALQCVGAHVDISRTRIAGVQRRPAPLLGQHTREILEELGLSAAEIDRCYRDGIVA